MNVKLPVPQRKKKCVAREAPFPVPIASITHESASNEWWFYYTGYLCGSSVVVQHSGDMHFLHRMGCFGKGNLSRSQPLYNNKDPVIREFGDATGVKVISCRRYICHLNWKHDSCLNKENYKFYKEFDSESEECNRSEGESNFPMVSSRLSPCKKSDFMQNYSPEKDEDWDEESLKCCMRDDVMGSGRDGHLFKNSVLQKTSKCKPNDKEQCDEQENAICLMSNEDTAAEMDCKLIKEFSLEESSGSKRKDEEQWNVEDADCWMSDEDTAENVTLVDQEVNELAKKHSLEENPSEYREKQQMDDSHWGGKALNNLCVDGNGSNFPGESVMMTKVCSKKSKVANDFSISKPTAKDDSIIGFSDDAGDEKWKNVAELNEATSNVRKVNRIPKHGAVLKSDAETQFSETITKMDSLCYEDECNGDVFVIGDEPGQYIASSDQRRPVWLPTLKHDPYPLTETLHLTLEEAFFLSYGLGCLMVRNVDKEPMNLTMMWRTFCGKQSDFIPKYIAYHYYRSRGWVPKPGLKFGTDYILYKEGQAFYHATFSVVVQMVDEETLKTDAQRLSWTSLTGLDRMTEHVAKQLVFCHVIKPKNITEEELLSPKCIQMFTVKSQQISICCTDDSRKFEDGTEAQLSAVCRIGDQTVHDLKKRGFRTQVAQTHQVV